MAGWVLAESKLKKFQSVSRDNMIHVMKTDEQLLSTIPEHICIGTLMKASPKQDGASRILYIEASNEDTDRQNEIVLQKALLESAEYYLRHGNVDISHYTIIGPKSGIPDYMSYEIGKPLEVKVDGTKTFIKAELYQGDSAMARNADIVWDSLTKQSPPARWYASVGGAVLSKSVRVDEFGNRVAVVDKVRWNNTALDRCPVNKTVGEVSTMPTGVFAKSLDAFVVKTLSTGYGTDSAVLAGGEALRMQSLDTGWSNISYQDFRNQLAGKIRHGGFERKMGMRSLYALAEDCGLPKFKAVNWVKRFMRDLKNGD